MTGDEYKNYLSTIDKGASTPELNSLADNTTVDGLASDLQDDLEQPNKRKSLFQEVILTLGFDVRTFLANTVRFVCDYAEASRVSETDLITTIDGTDDSDLSPVINSTSDRLLGMLKAVSLPKLKSMLEKVNSERPKQEQLLAVLLDISNSPNSTPTVDNLARYVRCSKDKELAKNLTNCEALCDEIVATDQKYAPIFAECASQYVSTVVGEDNVIPESEIKDMRSLLKDPDVKAALIQICTMLGIALCNYFGIGVKGGVPTKI